MKTIYHVITQDCTVTLLNKMEMDAWTNGMDPASFIIVESRVTETLFGQLREWRDGVSDETIGDA